MSASPADALRAGLNDAQWEAVSHEGGPLLVLAGAGSGKTRVLTHRIAYLVACAGVPAGAILALTFTNKAAREMRRRVAELLGGAADRMWLGTFHGICLRLLRANGDRLAVGREFAVYDTEDQKRLLAEVVRELGLDTKRFAPGALAYRIQRLKDEGLGAGDMPTDTWYDRGLAAVFERYQERLRAAPAVDFGDLLLETERLLRDHADVADHYRRRFRHVLIDEFQDTNRVQYRIAATLAGGHGNLCVVGDDDQSIYGWRGADIRNILAFEQDFPGTRVVKLEQNYRSTQQILDAAWSVVDHNRSRHPKRLWTARTDGEPVQVREADGEEEEATWVADTVEALRSAGYGYADVAVLYRMHALSRPFEDAFLRRGVPYVVYGGLRFYDRKEVKDALAYLRLVLNPDDPVAFGRAVNTPARGIGPATVARVTALAREEGIGIGTAAERSVTGGLLRARQARALGGFLALIHRWQELVEAVPVRELLLRILEDSGYLEELQALERREAEDRRANLEELLNAAEAFERDEGGDLRGFLDRAALVTDQDRGPDRAEVVTLMTLHAAKGLEYPVVFLTGLEEGVFPHHRSSDSDRELEEERRLCYVGMTRARDRLFLTRARVRRVYGADGAVRLPSRFLHELPPGVFRRVEPEPAPPDPWSAPTEALSPPPADGRYFLPEPGEAAYRQGMAVRHARYGPGRVLRVDGRGVGAKVTVRFQDAGTRKFLAAMAALEIALDD